MTESSPANQARKLVYKVLLPYALHAKRIPHLEDSLNLAMVTGKSIGKPSHSSQAGLDDKNKGFASFLAYTVIRKWFIWNHWLQQHLKTDSNKKKRLDPSVVILIGMGLIQLADMDSVPDFAACASTLSLADELGLSKPAKGFINAMLQQFIREGKQFAATTPETSLPDWWLERLSSQLSPETINEINTARLEIPRLGIRINTLKIGIEDYHERLREAGIEFEPIPDLPECLLLKSGSGNPTQLPGFENGDLIVQDPASASVAIFLAPQPGQRILEIGAAPGTKTTHLAALMQNTGEIVSVDVSEKRLQRLTLNCERLGVTIVKPLIWDATTPFEKTQKEKPTNYTESDQVAESSPTLFDAVLVDAPCSGLGTTGKHPEILLTFKPSRLPALIETQQRLLQSAISGLKPGGILVYSTCSIDSAENHEQVQTLLARHSGVTLVEEKLLFPTASSDGFYMAKLQRH